MTHSQLLNRLVQLSARIDSVLEFAIPNARAVRSAISKAAPQMPRDAWQELFRGRRLATPKPLEKVSRVALRLPNTTTLTGPFIGGHNALRDKAISKALPGAGSVTLRPDEPKFGFKTNRQPFVSRKEGLQIIRRHKQRALRPGNYREGLHSSDMT